MNITLKCEQLEYDIFTGKAGKVERTISHEFSAIDVQDAVENFELFLRGIGYIFDGQLEIVETKDVANDIDYETQSHVINSMVNDLVKNARPHSIDMKSVNVQPINSDSNVELCSRCGISKSVMMNHVCWDSVCPVHDRK